MSSENLCGHCLEVMGQIWCEELQIPLANMPGNEPLTPPDCKIREITNDRCIVLAQNPPEEDCS